MRQKASRIFVYIAKLKELQKYSLLVFISYFSDKNYTYQIPIKVWEYLWRVAHACPYLVNYTKMALTPSSHHIECGYPLASSSSSPPMLHSMWPCPSLRLQKGLGFFPINPWIPTPAPMGKGLMDMGYPWELYL